MRAIKPRSKKSILIRAVCRARHVSNVNYCSGFRVSQSSSAFLPLSICEPRKGDRDRDNRERDQHPILNLEAENRGLPHKPVAHPDPPQNARLQPGADGGLTRRAEPARKVGTGFPRKPAGAGLAGGLQSTGRSAPANLGPVSESSGVRAAEKFKAASVEGEQF